MIKKLPPLEIHTTPDDIKYALFKQSDVVSNEIRSNGIWNAHVLDVADRIISKIPGKGKIFDIGAGIGTFCIPLALSHERFEFFAYEAQRVLALQLSTNVLINNLNSVTVHNCVVAHDESLVRIPDVEIERCENHQSYSLNKKMNEFRSVSFGETVDLSSKHKIESRSLDSYDEENVILLKISVNGMEIDVLNGAVRFLVNNNFPPVIFETWQYLDWYKDYDEAICKKLIDIGYDYFHDMGSHKIAFKTTAEFNFYMREDNIQGEIAGFMIGEHLHSASDSIQNQKPIE